MNKPIKLSLYVFSSLLALSLMYAGYEVTLGNKSLFDTVKEIDLREKAPESNRVLLSNTTYDTYYIERWQISKCTTSISEEKYLLPQTTEIWFCKTTEEVHDLKECELRLPIKEEVILPPKEELNLTEEKPKDSNETEISTDTGTTLNETIIPIEEEKPVDPVIDQTKCWYTEKEYYLCKEGWVRITK